ncbi:MAG: L-threonylcarbamoyladenylate synthase [Natronincolaceae bacterium]|jgi:L-threonylcarbamoyladenylate synthase|nr:L-threonylcarbamoyladenylate synthase [Bacillota bacterium]NLK90724.1 threonylcarbamoyl-AMP synthase [Clostridiales bacterium]
MKDTIIIKIDAENIDGKLIEKCAEILREGGIVAFPTETVYGLGADALNSGAVKRIFEAKGRPPDNPLIIHVSKTADILPLVKEIPENAYKVMEKFWPGPLTLIFKKSNIVPRETSGGLSTVAIRMPDHPIAIKLIEKSGAPIAAPSANISGKLSPTKAEHVIEDLMGKADVIIAGGDCDVGVESTVLDMTGEVPVILRPGVVSRETLEKVLGRVLVNSLAESLDKTKGKPDTMNTKHIHYSPKAKMMIIQGGLDSMVAKINELKNRYGKENKKVGIICTDETRGSYEKDTEEIIIKSLGSRKHPETIAANLFKILREFDKTDVEIILCESINDTEIGQAIMDRLKKAASTIV